MSRDDWGTPEPDVPAIAMPSTPSTDSTGPWPAWCQVFLDLFAQTGNVMLSARGAGVDRTRPYQFRNRDEAFAAAWVEADTTATQHLEAEARNRAMKGSDRLLIFLLQARDPARYRPNYRVELTGDGGGPLRHQVVPEGLDDHERAALRMAIDAELARRGAEVDG